MPHHLTDGLTNISFTHLVSTFVLRRRYDIGASPEMGSGLCTNTKLDLLDRE